MDFIDKLADRLGLTELYENAFNRLFAYTLKKDIEKKEKYEGYPTATTKKMEQLTQRTGIPFVNHAKRDYTFSPMIEYLMVKFGTNNTPLHQFLNWVNMKSWGEPTKHGRLKAQKKLLDSYLEYESKHENVSIIDSLLNQKHPYYIKKILAEYKIDAVERGLGFKDFILNNKNYFHEIAVFFEIDERTVVDSARDASNELDSLVKSSFRDQLMKANFLYTGIDMIVFIITFGEYLVPMMLDQFGVGIENFSKSIRVINNLSHFLVRRWFIVLPIAIIIYLIGRAKFIRILIDYVKIKIPLVNDYVLGDELVKFLKTYHNIMGHVTPRQAFEYSYNRLNNEYLKHIMRRNLDGTDTDLSVTAKPLSEVLEGIPYIRQEYLDMMSQSYAVGKPQEGLEKVIDIVEPRVENTSKKLNKYIIMGTFIITTLVTLFFAFIMYRDVMVIVEVSDQMFLDELRK